jgi:hypothetical protein
MKETGWTTATEYDMRLLGVWGIFSMANFTHTKNCKVSKIQELDKK